MRYRYSVVVALILSVQFLFSQDKVVNLNSAMSGTQDITAQQSIILGPGFSYTPSSGNYFKASIDKSIIADAEYLTGSNIPDPDLKEINTNLNVGSTQGILDVTPLGAATYSIPIFIPPGTGGMVPNISINYNSQSGNGILGWGWSLLGLSAITRTGKPYYLNQDVQGITMLNDYFAIDGNRLMLQSGTYGSDGSTYETEMESFCTITAHSSSGSGPLWFEVEYKNGTIVEYGNSDDSRIENILGSVLGWNITKVTDTIGNYMEYHYDQYGEYGQKFLRSIKYTGNQNVSLDPYNEIYFVYDKREDENDIRFQGVGLEKQELILISIESRSEGNLVRKYDFKFKRDLYSSLCEITESAGTGEELNSTIIEWGSLPDDFIEIETTTLPTGNQKVFPGDFNGDGLADYIIVPDKTMYSSTDQWKLYLFIDGEYSEIDNGYLDESFQDIFVADENSDGKNDVYFYYYDYVEYYCDCDEECLEWALPEVCCDICYYYENEFKYFYLEDDELITNSNKDIEFEGQQKIIMLPGDFDGNGETDLLFLNENDYDIRRIENINAYLPDLDTPDFVSTLDFNGNGKSDIFYIKEGDLNIIEYSSSNQTFSNILTDFFLTYDNVHLGDFNGDSKVDLFVEQGSNSNVLFSAGEDRALSQITTPIVDNKTVTPNPQIDPYGPFPITFTISAEYKLIVSDFNFDGKTDVLKTYWVTNRTYNSVYSYFEADSTEIAGLYLSYGLGFEYCDIDYIDEGFLEFSGIDNNFDGVLDLRINLSNDEVIEFFPNDNSKLVKSITNGMNFKQEIEYQLLTDYEVYTSTGVGYTFPISYAHFPLRIVSKISSFDNNTSNLLSEIDYSYSDLKYHRQGKGLLGFTEFVIDNQTTADKVITNFDYDNTYYNVFASEIEKFIGENSITYIENCQTIEPLDSGTRFFSYTSNSINEDLLNNTEKEITVDINSSGNLISTTTEFFDSSENKVAETIEEYDDYNSFGLPGSITVTNSRNSQSIIREKSMLYYSNGLLQKETLEFGEEYLETAYTYDDFGNILTKSVSEGINSRKSTFIYEQGKGRFLLTETNPLNLTNIFEYDTKTGNIVVETDQNDLSTLFLYDKFGNLAETILPTGQTITTENGWSIGNENIGELYFKKISSNGTPDSYYFYDILGREVRSKTEGFDGTFLITDKEFDTQGRLEKSYMPYLEGTNRTQYIDYSYDALNRISSETVYPQDIEKTYTYDPLEITTSIGTREYTKTYDETGLLIEVNEPGGTTSYSYNPEGKIASIISPSGTTGITYDTYGYQGELQDIDAGTIDYDYNIWGDLVKQTDEEDNVVEMEYDSGGRLVSKEYTGGVTITYDYNETTGFLDGIISDNDTQHSYTYDEFGRLSTKTEEIDQNNIYTASYAYNSNSDIESIEINDYATISYGYNPYGYIEQVDLTTSAGTTTVWEGNSMNKYGIIDNFDLGNDIQTSLTFDQYGYLNKIESNIGATAIQDWDYDFNTTFGNVTKRKGLNSPSTYNEETFTYDSQDRLLTYTVGENTLSLTYDSNGKGNIQTKTDVGTYGYSTTYPHQIEEITNPSTLMQDLPSQDITYTKFNKVSTIGVSDTGLDKDLTITYGPDQQRVKTVLQDNSSTVLTKYFALGMYEKEVHATNGTRELYYINTPSGLSAILESKSSGDDLYYIHTDIIGSYDVITDEEGNVVERLSFDPWGRRRNSSTWDYTSVPTSYLFDRGFTGHEHLDDFGLLNMNGRVYDPILAMFISPDNYIQSPNSTQNLNRYTYCLNNPLIYTDPDGELAWFIPVIVGAVLFGGGNVAIHASQGDIDNFWDGLGYFAQGAVAGAIVGATWSFGLASLSGTGLLNGGSIIQGMNFASQGFAQYAGWAIMGGKAINTLSTITSMCNNFENAGNILLGRTYFHKQFGHGFLQSLTRYTWEGLQTWSGYNFSQFRNTFGGVDRVDYLGGATFVTGENREYRQGVSLGNYPNIWLWDEIEGSFEDRVISDPLFMHEYGHTFDSQIFGISYLLAIGLPSLISAGSATQVPDEPFGVTTHDFRWYEMRANRHGARYFNKYFGVDWTPYETMYPRRRR